MRAALLLLLLAATALGRDTSGPRPRPVELLGKIDPKRHAVLGAWTLEEGALKSPLANSQPYRIEIPYAPGDEYDLTVVVERKEGNPPFIVGLVAGDRQISIDFDGWGGNDKCGISMIDGNSGEGNESARKGKLLTNDKPSTIICSVRKGGVRAVVDGVKVIDWKGDRSRLSLWGGWKMPRKTTPFLAAWGGRFHVTRVTLNPVSGSGKDLR